MGLRESRPHLGQCCAPAGSLSHPGEEMARLVTLQGPALEAVTMLLEEMEEEEETELEELEVIDSSDAGSVSDGMMNLDIDK